MKDPNKVQALADEAVWYHGTDPLHWPESVYRKMSSLGIEVSDLTRVVLETAYKNSRASLEERCKENSKDPSQAFPVAWAGNTESGGEAPPEVSYADKDTRETARNNLRLLREQPGLYNRAVDTPEETPMMRVKESDFRRMLKLMNIPGADDLEKWSLNRINNRKLADFESFKKMIDAPNVGAPPEGSAAQVLMRKIRDHLEEAPGSVRVVADEDFDEDPHHERENGQGASRKKGTQQRGETMATTTATKKEKKTPQKRQADPDNPFGTRPGSQSHLICRALSLKPKTASEIAEETGLEVSRVSAHLNYQLKAHPDALVRTDGGYALARSVAANSSRKSGKKERNNTEDE